jgi:prepilin-type N-terminal cleavage/methylation domain-containing protein
MHTTAGSANKRGFTLLELLIVISILMILVGVVILSVGNVFGTARKTAYTSVRQQVQTAVIAYQAKSLGNYPLTGNTTVIDGKTLGIIDACALLASSGSMLREVPDGFISTPDNDNCDSGEYNCSCDLKAHYIWTVDVNGNIYSSCIDTILNGGGCINSSSDGFQGVWP